jgi:D-xylose transport system substrate-binding protein
VISQGAKVIVLDPVDSTAAASLVRMAQGQGIKVIAYDRPVPSTPADYYVSFDNEGIGKAIAESLVQHLKANGRADRPRAACCRSTARRPTRRPD